MVETYAWFGAGGVFETRFDSEDWAWDGVGGECECCLIGDERGRVVLVLL